MEPEPPGLHGSGRAAAGGYGTEVLLPEGP